MKKSMRKGFTLVELLIVIVVIGILSAMMMLSSTEAVSSARAADIISDLRNLKTACLAWYADNLDYVEATGFKGISSSNTDDQLNIAKYMGNEGIGDYFFTGNNSGTWCVWCTVSDSKVRDKLKSRATTVGLRGSDGTSDASSGDVYSGQNNVGLFIR